MTHNESVFAMAGYSVFRHAGTEVDFCFIVEDNICCLIIDVKPELKPIKVLLPIVVPSSPAIANTFVIRNLNFAFSSSSSLCSSRFAFA